MGQSINSTTLSIANHYTDEEGLPQNSIKDIIEDDYGFIWLATEAGIVRFDGKDFRVFDKTNLSCIKSNRFRNILRIPELGTFAVTENALYVKIKDGRAFCEPKQEAILRAYRNKFDTLSDVLTTIATGLPSKFTFNHYRIRFIIPLGMQDFIECLPEQVRFWEKGRISESVNFSRLNCLGYFMVDKELYYLDQVGALVNIKRNGIKQCTFSGDILSNPYYKAAVKEISALWNIPMRNTLVYCGKSIYDVERLADGTLLTREILSNFDIKSEEIISHYYDRKNKRLFLGSRGQGLFVFQYKPFKVLTEQKEGAKGYYAIGIYDSNKLVTPNGVLFYADTIVPFVRQFKDEGINKSSIELDLLGNVWNKSRWNVICSDRKFNLKDTIKFNQEVTALYCSIYDTTLWVGLKDSGLYKLSSSAVAMKSPPQLISSKLPFATFLASESKEKLWVGAEKGLYLLNTVSHKLLCIDQLKNKNIRSLFVKAPGELWITTYGDGIYLLRGNKLNHLPYDQNKSLLASHCMVLDQNGFFWISTNKGLIKAARKDLIAYADGQQEEVFYQYFGKESGFKTNEFNGGCEPCGVRQPNGVVTFPSLDGLVQINPAKENEELPDKRLLIDRVEIDGRPVAVQDTLTIPKKFDNFSIYLSTVYFGSRKNLQIWYMLLKDNKEDQWYPVKDNTLTFTSLPSGSYKLRIRKINGFGKDNYDTLSLSLIVPYAFYEKLWFKLLIIAGLLLIVYAYIRIRLYFILQRNRLLDLQIARRTRSLTNTLRALKVSEASLRRQTQMQEMLIAAISHDIKSPMKYLTMVSKRMQQQLNKKDYVSLTAFNESIQDTSAKVYTILDNLVTYISFQLKGGRIREEAVDISKLVEDKINLFADIARTNNTELWSEINPGTLIKGDEALLAVIVHNLVDNAVKFTANGSVRIYGEPVVGDLFSLVIKDTGTGIPPELVRWLNTESEKGLKIETIGSHKGMGLIIIKELLAAASAGIDVISGDDGTTIKMYFKRYTTDL